MTKQQILFIHGAGRGSHDLDSKLADSLQRTLGTGYLVSTPQMPSEGAPAYNLWRDEIMRLLATYNDKLILAGHSLGASVLLKILSEEPIHNELAGLFLAATPFWDMEEYKLRGDFAAHLPKDLPIFLYQGREDETLPFSQVTQYAEKLPQATVRALDGRDHQLNDDLSEMARDIASLK